MAPTHDEFVKELNDAVINALTKALEEYRKLQDEEDGETIKKIKLRHDASRVVFANIKNLMETMEHMVMQGLATEELKEEIIKAREAINERHAKRKKDE